MDNSPQPIRPNLALALVGFTVLFGLALAGARALQSKSPLSVSLLQPTQAAWGESGDPSGGADIIAGDGPIRHQSGEPILTPTPDAPHAIPAPRTQVEQYTVRAGDSLALVAQRYGVSVAQLIEANNLANPDHVESGQVLTVPLPLPENAGPSFKIIPDSELVYGPTSASIDIAGFIQSQGGYLAGYREQVTDDLNLSGIEIVQRVATEYSVHPRLLLAVLEYQSGWLTQPFPKGNTLEYPLRLRIPSWKGLYRQLSWAANQLNRGYYLWRVNGINAWLLADGSVIPVSSTINAGTAGVQNMFALLSDLESWKEDVSENGVFETYNVLFGYPFDYAVEPLIPDGLQQPEMQLPFEPGQQWSFTGGPHGGWADGSAWAALDFAPPGDALGCVISDAWVVAVADGLIVRSENGAVLQDLDGDGNEGTGWAVLYMHVDTRDRVEPGVYLKAGDRVGHPSCEGGVSSGTHLHLARKYNGEWIAADQNLPFVLDGWVSSGAGREYDGYMERDGQSIEAYSGRSDINQIER